MVSPSSSLQVRHRRQQFLQDRSHDELKQRKKKLHIVQRQNEASNMLAKFYMILISFLALILISVIIRFHWKQMIRKDSSNTAPTKPRLPTTVVSFYPSNISPRRDMKRLAGTNLVYATPENQEIRNMVRHAISLKDSIKKVFRGKGRVQFLAWEQNDVEQFLMKELVSKTCGDDFVTVYNTVPQFARQDLVLWCLLVSKNGSGGFVPMSLQESGGGLAVLGRIYKRQDEMSLAVVNRNEKRVLSNSLILVKESSSFPQTVLDYLVRQVTSGINEEEGTFRRRLELFLFQQIQRESSWLLLDAKCQPTSLATEDRSPLARQCRSFQQDKKKQNECCDVFAPPPDEQREERNQQVGNSMLRHA